MSAALRRLLAAGARAALRSHVERVGATELPAAALDRPCASLAGSKRFSTLVNVVRLSLTSLPAGLGGACPRRREASECLVS